MFLAAVEDAALVFPVQSQNSASRLILFKWEFVSPGRWIYFSGLLVYVVMHGARVLIYKSALLPVPLALGARNGSPMAGWLERCCKCAGIFLRLFYEEESGFKM